MNDTTARKDFGFFTVERATEIIKAHDDQELKITFLKRTNGEWREMWCRVSEFLPHDLLRVVEIQYDAHDQGDMFGEPGPPTAVKNIPLDSISDIEAEYLSYSAT